MYKVLIVDDEDIILRGLEKVMHWAEYNCTVIGTANNGEKALELINTLNPDILFTDICMPKMNGLQTIELMRTEHPFLKITILSGHSEFDYAQKAIEYGVTRYILKPSKISELEDAVKVMVSQLDAEKEARELFYNEKSSKENFIAKDDAGDTSQNFIIKNAIKYIEEHYSEKLTLKEVAENVYVSQWHLSKLIAKNTEHSFSDILNGIRIEKAKQLLAEPSLRISDISETVGFSDVTHFSRIFKKHIGVSANEYRNSSN